MAGFETELLNYVIRNGTVRYSELAKKFKKTSPAIYAAIKRLKQKKILLGVYPKIDLAKFGYDFTAFILIKVDQKNIPALLKKHGEQKDITSIYEVSGEFDLLFIARLKSTKELYTIVEELTKDEKVAGIDTHIAYTTFKEGLNPWPLTEKEP